MARKPDAYEARVDATPVEVHGAILVWGAVREEGRRSVMEHYGFADVLPLEAMLDDLRAWKSPAWMGRVAEVRQWTLGLLDAIDV